MNAYEEALRRAVDTENRPEIDYLLTLDGIRSLGVTGLRDAAVWGRVAEEAYAKGVSQDIVDRLNALQGISAEAMSADGRLHDPGPLALLAGIRLLGYDLPKAALTNAYERMAGRGDELTRALRTQLWGTENDYIVPTEPDFSRPGHPVRVSPHYRPPERKSFAPTEAPPGRQPRETAATRKVAASAQIKAEKAYTKETLTFRGTACVDPSPDLALTALVIDTDRSPEVEYKRSFEARYAYPDYLAAGLVKDTASIRRAGFAADDASVRSQMAALNPDLVIVNYHPESFVEGDSPAIRQMNGLRETGYNGRIYLMNLSPETVVERGNRTDYVPEEVPPEVAGAVSRAGATILAPDRHLDYELRIGLFKGVRRVAREHNGLGNLENAFRRDFASPQGTVTALDTLGPDIAKAMGGADWRIEPRLTDAPDHPIRGQDTGNGPAKNSAPRER